jgi:putative photosynthetic complex assembly protein 2
VSEFLAPGIYTALVWWFTTGLILYIDRLDPATFRRSMGCGLVILVLAGIGLKASAGSATLIGAYLAFTATVLVWGCLEMSFLLGFVTGPRRHACAAPCHGWRHFLHATQAIIYNELATVAGFGMVVALTWHAANLLGPATYAVLWTMRLSAKLNLFLGVPNVGEQFLPAHLRYLGSYFRRRAMNWLFPVSLTAAGYAAVCLARRYGAAQTPYLATGYALLLSLLGLAILEHLFMVLPLPSEKLWQRALKPTGE